ncbi:flagellar protein FlgN [Methylomonas montana]|uniref:flagella synthesis protein FlgN n=1 Tax=Methylomonas montana TaxID=3058963 RepID=UPI00265B1C67|nr:flagellar protein FlgN [Methylomonas montana]WKJ89864.1 flagellar protein FlgN [Methylomonas montana]
MIEKTYLITEKLLNNGLNVTQNLLELLNAESDKLKQTVDPDVISAIAANKKDLVVQLEQFTKQLGQVLATEQLAIGNDGIKTYLIKAKETGIDISETWNCWHRISKLAEKCRAVNEQNGASIALLSRHTQRSLQILRGKSPLAATYGPDGVTRNELFSHTLISV